MPEFQERLQAAMGKDYVIERELGGGGMSRVFVAIEQSLGRRVVVKVLPPDLSVGVNIERFRREIQLAAQLQHPHIVPLLTASSDRELLWFTMPFIEGSSLRRTVEKSGRLAPRDVVRILHDVVDALAYAHARGIVHRDIKPDNILTSGMHALVTDFGVAKALSAAIPSTVGTTTGMAIGTPAYMAPEQLAADPAADHRVDIYGVGLLAYELLTGKSPFSGPSPQATLAAQLTKVPAAPHREIADIPEQLSAIIMHCLEKDASRRFQTAADLLAALDALPPMPSSGSLSAPVSRSRSKGRALVIAVLLAAVGGVAYSVMRTGGTGARGVAGDSIPRSAAGSARDRDTAARRRADSSTANSEALAQGYARDESRNMSVPVVISRAESLAIAEAFRGRSGPSTPAAATPPLDATLEKRITSADVRIGGDSSGAGRAQVVIATPDGRVVIERAQLLKEVQRVLSDSLALAFARVESTFAAMPRTVRMESPRMSTAPITPMLPPPAPGTLRVVVTPFAPRGKMPPDAARYGFEVADALRVSLASANGIEVPDPETTSRANSNGDRMSTGWRLRADYVVSGYFMPRGDSISVVTHFTDVRTGHYSRAGQVTVAASELQRATERSTAMVRAWADTAQRQPARRPGPSDGRGRGDR